MESYDDASDAVSPPAPPVVSSWRRRSARISSRDGLPPGPMADGRGAVDVGAGALGRPLALEAMFLRWWVVVVVVVEEGVESGVAVVLVEAVLLMSKRR